MRRRPERLTGFVLLLGEQRELGASFFAGVAIVLGVVLAYPALRRAPQR